jgi:hypothetical protein
MKRFMSLVTIMLVLLGLASCSVEDFNYKEDTQYAYAEVTTSDGQAFVFRSKHGRNAYYEKLRGAKVIQYVNEIIISEKDTATVHFFCEECGYEEVLEGVKAPSARVFQCECKENLNEQARKEYIAVCISLNDEEADS